MSDQSTSTTREITAIFADFTSAKAALKALPAEAKKADVDKANEAVEALKAEFKAAEKGILEAQYAAKQVEYNAATTAGVKAALRRDMNKLREQLGLPALIAGSKSSGPRFDPAVLAILDGTMSVDDDDEVEGEGSDS